MSRTVRMARYSFILGVASFTTFWSGLVVFGQEIEAELIKRFQNEAPKAWNEMKAAQLAFFNANRGWTMDYSITGFTIDANENRSEHENSGSITRCGRLHLINIRTSPREGIEELMVINPQYLFTANRPIGKDRWVLDSLHQRDASLPSRGWYDLKREELDSDSHYLVLLHSYQPVRNLSDHCPLTTPDQPWLDLPDLKIKSAVKQTYDGKEAVRIEMTFQKQFWIPSRPPVDRRYNCVAVFDPDRYWSLLQAEGRFLDGEANEKLGVEYHTYKYETEIGGYPIRTAYDIKNFLGETIDDPHPIRRVTTMNSTIETKNVPLKEFTLTAFGFQEADWHRPPSRWWLYSLVAGGFLLVTVIVLSRLAKRGQN